MAFNINDMMSTLAFYQGFHKPSHFLVRVYPPRWLIERQVVRDLEFLCEATNLPGLQLETVAIRPLGYGTPENRPVDTGFPPVRCDFFADNGSQVLELFQLWMRNINNSGVDIRESTPYTKLKYYEFAYPKDYEGVIEIYMFDGQGEEIRKVTLEQVFPVNIGDLSLAWEINDTVSRVPVTLSYNLWYNEIAQGEEVEEVNRLSADVRNRLEAAAPGTPPEIASDNPRGPR